MTTQDRILNICKKIPALKELYDSQVRHYTITEHTINVLNQFEKYFASQFSEIEIEMFRLFLLLHDIGKPNSHKKGNRDNQYSETIKIISENKQELNFSVNDFLLFNASLNAGSWGLDMQN